MFECSRQSGLKKKYSPKNAHTHHRGAAVGRFFWRKIHDCGWPPRRRRPKPERAYSVGEEDIKHWYDKFIIIMRLNTAGHPERWECVCVREIATECFSKPWHRKNRSQRICRLWFLCGSRDNTFLGRGNRGELKGVKGWIIHAFPPWPGAKPERLKWSCDVTGTEGMWNVIFYL